MCGKSNPAAAESCQYCQAQLRPLGQPENKQPSEPSLPDWLNEKSPFSTQPLGESSPEEASELTKEEIPGWLARIRQRELDEQKIRQENQTTPFAADEEETPSWAAGITASEESAEEDSEENWLERLRRNKAISRPDIPDNVSLQAAGEEPVEPPDDEADWMKQLKNFQSTEASTFKDGFSTSPDTDQKTDSAQAAESTAGTAEEDEFSSWLRSLEEQSHPAPPSEKPPEKAAVPSFLEDVDLTEQKMQAFESETGAPPEGELPFWLADVPSGKNDEKTPEALIEDGTPEWLKAFAEPAEDSALTPVSEEETPEWLRGFETETQPQDAQEEKPVWLETAEEKPSIEEPAAGAEASVLPDWLKDFKTPAEESAVQPEEPVETTPEIETAGGESQVSGGGLQDWLSQLPAEEPEEHEEKGYPLSEPPELKTEPAHEGSQPETQPQDSSPDEFFPAAPSETVFQFDDEDVKSPESAIPFVNQDVAEWDTPATASSGGTGENNVEGLTPATLPGWLEAMRPVEAIIGGQAEAVDEEQIEVSGPLAGLPGVLPPENIITQYRKPPVYSAKLQVTERQRTQAGILEEMIRSAGKAQALQKENPEAPRLLIRFGLALILIFAILYPILFGQPTTETPGLATTAEILTFSNQIESLSPSQTVLLAVDYDAGYSGEMRFAAKGVIQRLLQKQLNLALISTVPAGPVLAEDLLQRASSELLAAGALPAPLSPENVVNLGYLPGGLSSLHELALDPQQAARSAFTSPGKAETVWENPPLQGIASLSDFAAVIVLTDSLETGRAWVEQTCAWLGNTPLLMVSSAQAAPMLKTYLSSGQVDGLLSGLMDGMTYERLAKTPGNAAAYWNAYRYGMYVMVAFLISGVILRATVWLLSRRSPMSR